MSENGFAVAQVWCHSDFCINFTAMRRIWSDWVRYFTNADASDSVKCPVTVFSPNRFHFKLKIKLFV